MIAGSPFFVYLAECPKRASRGSQEGSRRAPGGLRRDFEVALGAMGGPWDGPRRSRGGHERFEPTFSNVFKPSDALSLHFPILLGPRALSPYACAAKSSGGEFGMTQNLWFFIDFWPWAGNLQGGVTVPVCLTPVTCYLIPVTCHLIPATCTCHLYLYLNT